MSQRPEAGTSGRTAEATSGSRTIVAEATSSEGPSSQTSPQTTTTTTSTTLRLRGAHATREGRRVEWTEDTVDNEGLGRKSSKVCCIYHPPHDADESSEEESSSSDSDSDAEIDPRKRARRRREHQPHRDCGHDHDHDHGDNQHDGPSAEHNDEPQVERPRSPSPNAYERIPKLKKKRPTGA